MTNLADFKQHFLKLCANEEADVQWCDSPSEALALSGELEFILTPHITSEIAYAVAMHELGHIKSRDQSSNQMERDRYRRRPARCSRRRPKRGLSSPSYMAAWIPVSGHVTLGNRQKAGTELSRGNRPSTGAFEQGVGRSAVAGH